MCVCVCVCVYMEHCAEVNVRFETVNSKRKYVMTNTRTCFHFQIIDIIRYIVNEVPRTRSYRCLKQNTARSKV